MVLLNAEKIIKLQTVFLYMLSKLLVVKKPKLKVMLLVMPVAILTRLADREVNMEMNSVGAKAGQK